MKIANISSQSFGISFVNNSAYRNVKKYAIEKGHIKDFNRVVEQLKESMPGNVEIRYGVDSENKAFSTFTFNDITICNTPYDGETGLEASYRGLIDLGHFSGRYKTLTGTNYIKTRAGV